MKTINLLFFLSFALSWAQQDSRFVKGNRLYNDGKYRAAIESYEAILTDSLHSPELYFNLGNAHYKLSEVAPSIYYYEKGLQLSPKNKNIAYIDFLIAMTFYEQVQIVARDQTYTKAALKEFRNVVKKYPTSKYAKESELKIDLINEQLAGKHMYLARFYMKKSKCISELKRLNIII